MPNLSKKALSGNASTIFMLAFFTVVWAAIIPWGFGWNLFPTSVFVIFVLYAIWLIIKAIKAIRAIRKLPDSPSSEEEKRISKLFGITFGAETILIMAAGIIFGNGIIGDYNYVTPVIALIVGVHFIPLGLLFHVRLQIILGIIISVVAIATIFMFALTDWMDIARGICGLITAICVAVSAAYLLQFIKKSLR